MGCRSTTKDSSNGLDLGLEHNVGHQPEDNNHGSQSNDVVPELITSHGDLLKEFLWIPKAKEKNYNKESYNRKKILPIMAVGCLLAGQHSPIQAIDG